MRFLFVHCRSVARASRNSFRRLPVPDRLCRRQTGKSRAGKCPETPFAGIRRRPACFARRPDAPAASPARSPRAARPLRPPDAGARGVPARIPPLPQSGTRAPGGGDPARARSLRPLFGVGKAPPDTRMRGRPGGAGPRGPPRCFKGIHAALQRGKASGGWTAFGGHLPVPAGGTGRRSSRKAAAGGAAREPPRRAGDLLPPGPGRGDRPPRPRRSVSPGPGAGPERGRHEEERLRAQRFEAARRGPPPGASAHKGGRRRDGPAPDGPAVMLPRRRASASSPARSRATAERCRLVRGQRDEGIMGEARQGDRHGAPLRAGPRAAAERRGLRPEDQHAECEETGTKGQAKTFPGSPTSRRPGTR